MASELGVQTIQHTNGTDALTVGSDGVVTAPQYLRQTTKPVVSLKHTSHDAPGSGGLLTGWTTQVSQGGISYSSGQITVPVDGIYKISVGLMLDDGGGVTQNGIHLYHNTTYVHRIIYADTQGGNYDMSTGELYLSMSASDTVELRQETANARWFGGTPGLGHWNVELVG